MKINYYYSIFLSSFFNIDLKDKTCIDIGSSTGGFTDLMLQNGAKKVFAVDCGTNQLDYKLRIDSRVVSLENTNARYLIKENVNNEDIDLITIDVSFISLTKIVKAASELLKTCGELVALIKPQFEAGKEYIEKGGVVRDKKVHIDVVRKICDFCTENGFTILGLDYSPIKGPAGNIEYLLYAKKDDKNDNCKLESLSVEIDRIVDNSHEALNKEV